jgi:hypothetical protein
MFLFRVKVEELDASRLLSLKNDLSRNEEALRAHCPIREMSVVTENSDGNGELDIYLALDDFIGSDQLRRLVGELNSLLDFEPGRGVVPLPRVSSELIHI